MTHRVWFRWALLCSLLGFMLSCSGGYLDLTKQCLNDDNCKPSGPNLICKDYNCVCPQPFSQCPAGCLTNNIEKGACACLNLQRSNQHCGTCGNRCTAPTACCGGSCRDFKTDAKHCGFCDIACSEGPCCQGVCCSAGEQCCDGKCVAINVDPRHCGSCGNSCSICCGGKCCGNHQACCNNQCIDSSQNSQHCGRCNNKCGLDTTCCAGVCENVESNAKHCGACGTTCGTFACCERACCDSTKDTCCPTGCTNLKDDPKACGDCDNQCEANEVCCQGQCTNLDTNQNHCGSCGNSCGGNIKPIRKVVQQTKDGQEDMTFVFSGLPAPTPVDTVEIHVEVYGDFNSSNEKATIKIEGITVGRLGGGEPQCNTALTPSHTDTYPLPQKAVESGSLTVVVDLDKSVSLSTCRAKNPRVVVTLSYRSLSCCNGRCISIKQNISHCGQCNKACQTGEICCDGNCCASGESCCEGTCCRSLAKHREAVTALAYSPDGKMLISGSYDDTILFWNLSTHIAGQTNPTRSHRGNVQNVTISPDGKNVASTGGDNLVKIWDIQTGKIVRTLTGHTKAIFGLSYHPNGKTIVSSSNDRTARIWDANSGMTLFELKGHTNNVLRAVFHPQGLSIATLSSDRTIQTWDTATGKMTQTIKLTGVPVDMVYTPDGNWLLYLESTGTSSRVRIYTTQTYQAENTINLGIGQTNRIAVSHDSKKIAITHNNNTELTIQVWELASRKLLHILKGHALNVFSVAFHPTDSNRLASGSVDRNIRLWTLPPPEE